MPYPLGQEAGLGIGDLLYGLADGARLVGRRPPRALWRRLRRERRDRPGRPGLRPGERPRAQRASERARGQQHLLHRIQHRRPLVRAGHRQQDGRREPLPRGPATTGSLAGPSRRPPAAHPNRSGRQRRHVHLPRRHRAALRPAGHRHSGRHAHPSHPRLAVGDRYGDSPQDRDARLHSCHQQPHARDTTHRHRRTVTDPDPGSPPPSATPERALHPAPSASTRCWSSTPRPACWS